MDQIDLLKRIPKEHYTSHEGEMIKVGEVLKRLLEKDSKEVIEEKPVEKKVTGVTGEDVGKKKETGRKRE